MAASIADALRSVGVGPLEARALLRTALGESDAYLAAHPERALSADQRDHFLALAERRRAGEPLAYVTGEREFFSLAFQVTPAVLIPRPETEHLVEAALERIPENAPCRVLELGTGSGCIAVAIARHRPRVQLVATEIESAALAVARENARRHAAGNVQWMLSDWFAALGDARFDLIVANPPYVAEGDPHLSQGDLRFEPRAALAAGADGLDCIRAVVAGAPRHLAAGGWLLFEHGYDQAARCRALLAQARFREIFALSDLAGVPRVAGGRA